MKNILITLIDFIFFINSYLCENRLINMANVEAKINGNIIYMDDPNSVNINPDETIANSISQYQDMHIDVSLSATGKERTVLYLGSNGSVSNSTKPTTEINFLGFNQNKNGGDPNYQKFTTNYYDGSVGKEVVQYESFGITSVKISINSSYVPQVNIQFVDVRGLSFFNQDDSPYRVLFDFPPPIFKLKIKGYYGKPLEYQLHLVKYTTEFKSENGNFIIDAEFIAMTFAPLTDILFKYITNVPLIDINSTSELTSTVNGVTSNVTEKPENTYALILKLKSLYSEEKNKIEQSKTVSSYELTTTYSKNIIRVINNLNDYKNTKLKDLGNSLSMFVGKIDLKISDKPIYVKLNSVEEYDNYFRTDSGLLNPPDITQKLYIGYNGHASGSDSSYSLQLVALQMTALNVYMSIIKKMAALSGVEVNPSDATEIELLVLALADISYSESWFFTAIDITDTYVTLYRLKNNYNEKVRAESNQIVNEVNGIVDSVLGMKPTIYNVFKLILDDVDIFFNKLRKCSVDAETHHNKNKTKILSHLGNCDKFLDKIYAFPLIIDVKNNVQVRVSPKTISEPNNIFPELKFIYDFMDTFLKQARFNKSFEILNQKDENEIYKWIPISPFDSTLCLNSTISPYEKCSGFEEMMVVLLNRFYILTQFSAPSMFYNNNSKIAEAYLELYANGEAYNILLSTLNEGSLNNLKVALDRYKNNFNLFHDDIIKRIINVPNYYKLTNNAVINSGFDVSDIDRNNYISKNNLNYSGVTITNNPISIQALSDDNTTSQMAIFANNVKKKWYSLTASLTEVNIGFSDDNIIYFSDMDTNDFNLTRYINNNNVYYSDNTLNNGNLYLIGGKNYPKFNSFIDTWAKTLKTYYLNIQLILNANNTPLGIQKGSTLILSNFGYTSSPYNTTNSLNDNLYRIPSINQVPRYLPAYIGSLIVAKEHDNINEILSMFRVGNVDNPIGGLVAADYHDINNYMSVNDKKTFKQQYLEYTGGTNTDFSYETNRVTLNQIINAVGNGTYEKYVEVINKNSTNFTKQLMARVNLITNTESAFNYKLPTDLPLQYYQYFGGGGGTFYTQNKTKINDNFLKKFFAVLSEGLKKNAEKVKNEDAKAKNLKGDPDIINEMYYSFKNINDKWLTGPDDDRNGKGYPFNKKTNSLIDLFAFVDRGMNPIGDTVINPEILIQLADDPNVSVFSVLSQLLSMNHFEFFPLQNFITHTKDSWEDSFKIDAIGNDPVNSPFFVCMYVGGTSNYLSTNGKLNNGFTNDGIENIGTTDAIDLISENILDESNNTKEFKYNNVSAFNVSFGQQNQSMFTDFKIDSKDYPETNESIQIMSRLAGDENYSAPTAKGQNLYNVFENRAYSATIGGLGNAMIQPTQYFQLNNIPLYNGAYLILSVAHTVIPNHMTTSFTGTKIARYPVPRVTESSAIVDFEGTTGEFMTNVMNNIQTANAIPNNTLLPDNTTVKYSDGINYPQYNSPLNPFLNNVSISSKYGVDRGNHRHDGIDISAPVGTPVWAIKGGKLTYRDQGVGVGYGLYATICHPDNTYSLYGHFSSYADVDDKKNSQKQVFAGDVIGFVGNTGQSSENHLHFAVGCGEFNNNHFDPMPYLQCFKKQVDAS